MAIIPILLLGILLNPFSCAATPSEAEILSLGFYQCPQLSATATLSSDLSSLDILYQPEGSLAGESNLECLAILKLQYEKSQQLTIPSASIGSGEANVELKMNWGLAAIQPFNSELIAETPLEAPCSNSSVIETDLYVWTTFTPSTKARRNEILRRDEDLRIGLQLMWDDGCAVRNDACFNDRYDDHFCFCNYIYPCAPPGDGTRESEMGISAEGYDME